MSFNDRANGLGRWGVVEQHVAAAIDLDVDKARREPRVAIRQFRTGIACRDLSARNDGGDPLAVDQHGASSCKRRRRNIDAPRRRECLCSSRSRHFLQMPRPLDVGAAAARQAEEERIEALNETNRIGVGLIGRQCRQPARSLSRLVPRPAPSALAAQIGRARSAKPMAASSVGASMQNRLARSRPARSDHAGIRRC